MSEGPPRPEPPDLYKEVGGMFLLGLFFGFLGFVWQRTGSPLDQWSGEVWLGVILGTGVVFSAYAWVTSWVEYQRKLQRWNELMFARLEEERRGGLWG